MHNNLTIVSIAGPEKPIRVVVNCICGNTKNVRYNNLQTGAVKSCGCLNYKQGGLSGTPLYAVWNAMMQRCHNEFNKQYPDYGGRGITVCERWHQYSQFKADMGDIPFEGASIERLNNDMGYSPENCKWATRSEQNRNKRNNVYWEYLGRTLTLREWAEEFGINHNTVSSRVNLYGWSLHDALTIPVTVRRKVAA